MVVAIHENRAGFHLRVLSADRRFIDSSWNSKGVYSSFWRLYWNADEGASVHWSGGVFPILAGRVHLLPAWLKFSCENRRNIDHGFIHFEMTGCPPFVQQKVFVQPWRLNGDLPEKTAMRWMATFDETRRPGLDSHCLSSALVHLAMASVLENLPEPARRYVLASTSVDPRLKPALEHLENHFPDSLTNSHLAALCSMSEDYFIRRFRQVTGVPPHHYLISRRVREAAQLLVFSHRSIEEIADACGFSDRFHFTKVFTSVMGNSPARYRKNQPT